MDAYVFAPRATGAAVAALRDRVAPAGPIRVVLPLAGDHALYVAVTAPDQQSLTAALTDVQSADGVGDPSTHVVVPGVGSIGADPAAFPTYCAVDAWVGFAAFEFPPGFAGGSPIGVPGVVGVAVVSSDGDRDLLVEVTAGSEDGARGVLDAVAGQLGLNQRFLATGSVTDGAGFTRQ